MDREMNSLTSKLVVCVCVCVCVSVCVGATERDEHACARPVEWNSFDGHVQHMGTMPI